MTENPFVKEKHKKNLAEINENHFAEIVKLITAKVFQQFAYSIVRSYNSY